MLGERRAAILRLIIEYYIKTGEPIGSKTLCNLLPYAVSSATIRNEMAHLSNLGYLEQRHTSGGRVPGKNAYRFYVDHLMEPKALSPYETARSTNACPSTQGMPSACWLTRRICWQTPPTAPPLAAHWQTPAM